MTHEILSFQSLASTNDYLKGRYDELLDGSVCLALYQTKGKGRLGRAWDGDEGSLLFSILLKDEKYQGFASVFPIMTGAALLKTLDSYGVHPLIKWPNDIYLNDKKVAGILVEGVYQDTQKAIVIGIGINLNQEAMPLDLPNASSLKTETKKTFDKDVFLTRFLRNFDFYLNRLALKESRFMKYVQNNDYLKGKDVCFDYYGENLEGKALGIKEDGSIAIEKKDGTIISITSGEATLKKRTSCDKSKRKRSLMQL